MLSRGSLVYFDGTSAQTVVSGLRYANGVTLSADHKLFTVAETTAYRIRFSITRTTENPAYQRAIHRHHTRQFFPGRAGGEFPDRCASQSVSVHPVCGVRQRSFSIGSAEYVVTRMGVPKPFRPRCAPPAKCSASSVAAAHGPHLSSVAFPERGVLYCAKPAS